VRKPVESPTSTDSVLQIYSLGPPRVIFGGQRLAIPRRQARALLYRLAARLEPVPRDQLAYLFWHDLPGQEARRNLTRLLNKLRRSLPEPDLLDASADQVRLDPERVWCDASVFQTMCAIPEKLGSAVALYLGPFLEGFTLTSSPQFEFWMLDQQRGCERQYLTALATLLESAAARHAYAEAIDLGLRYLAIDELDETVHRRLITLYAASGDRGAASRQFERCTLVLERELGVGPLPETRAEFRAALQTVGADQGPTHPRPPRSSPLWATLPSLDVPLVGRDDALRQLEAAFDRAAGRVTSPQGGVFLISGEPGVGKSRLMQTFATRQASQALLLAGAAQRSGQSLPYHPLVRALRSAPPGLLVADPVWLGEASRLLPELRAIYPDLPAQASAAQDESRGRLFEALVQILLTLAERTPPLLLCLDDLHWADQTTLDWLAYLGNRLAAHPVLVIATCRSAKPPALIELCYDLVRAGVLVETELMGLEQDAVIQIVSHLLAEVSANSDGTLLPLTQRLHQVTAGNPFFLLETLSALIEGGWDPQRAAPPPDLPVPATVRQAVETRLAHLRPVARQILEAGAVLGIPFGYELIQRTAGRGEMETLEGLDQLMARRLLVDQHGMYHFHHEIIRAAVVNSVPAWRQQLLHRRAGMALQAIRSQDFDALSRHFEQGGAPGEAAAYALQAGESAKALFAYAEALAAFDRALGLLEQEAQGLQRPEERAANQRARIQGLYGRGWGFRLLGDMAAYERDTEQVALLADQLGDLPTLAHLHWRQAYAHRWYCRYAAAREAASAGLLLAQQAGDPLLQALCRRELGLVARETGAYDRARDELQRTLDLFSDLGNVVYQIHTLGNLSTLYRTMGEPQQALDCAYVARERCDQANLPLERRLPLGDIGAAALALGDLQQAGACLRESLVIAHQIGDRTQEILCLGHLGWLALRRGDAVRARAQLDAALSLARQVRSCAEQSWLHRGLAATSLKSGARDQARIHAQEALRLAEGYQRAYDAAQARQLLNELGQQGA
jgi:DNA-binding SARP family transcriptional activator/tetratricopeptide (TPR) repeat protein